MSRQVGRTREVKPSLLITLYKLIEVGAYPDEVIFTTSELAKLLGASDKPPPGT